jgi:hypothetical protein
MFVHISGHVSKGQKNGLLFISLLVVIALTTILANYSIPAYAHITKQFGNISLEVGWTEEPALVGQLNSAIIVVEKMVTGGNYTPVNNALSQLNIEEKYGGITKPIDFVPSEQAEGGYEVKIIPTRIGSYSLLMNGSIQNQNITNVEIPLDEVEGTQMFSFPDREVSGIGSGSTSGSGSRNNQTIPSGSNTDIGPKVEQILSQFSNDIDSIKGSIDNLNSNYVNIQNSIQNTKSASDISFIVGMAGVGAGISGVIISLIVLSRRRSID